MGVVVDEIVAKIEQSFVWLLDGVEDTLVWKGAPSSMYSISTVYS